MLLFNLLSSDRQYFMVWNFGLLSSNFPTKFRALKQSKQYHFKHIMVSVILWEEFFQGDI